MRTTMMLLAAGAAALGACKWTEFDDLQNETWVGSTEKPDIKTSDYGVAIQRGADPSESTTSGTLAVIGSGPGIYTELQYSANGAASLKTNRLQLPDLGVMTLDSPPILLASPTSAEVALITTGDPASIVVATGTHTLLLRQLFVGTNTTLGGIGVGNTPDAATYMQPLPFPGADPTPTPAPLVAAGDIVMGTIYSQPQGTKQPACKLIDGTTVIQVRALGTVKAGATDDVLVWNGINGKLLRYDGKDAFNGCTTTSPKASTSPANTPPFLPGHGSQILTIDDSHVLLQGHEDIAKGKASFLQVYDTSTLSPVGTAVTAEGLRSAAVLDTGTAKFVVAGYPTASVSHDGSSVPGGQVLLYKLSTGIDSGTPVATLYDAQPVADHQFGRAVAVMPFNGTSVIAVSAENEILMYFRLNTTDGTAQPIYGETRQGR